MMMHCSTFHHVNVVRLIGVCFKTQPRMIVLELLDGGDVKTFLRDSRPTAVSCPILCVHVFLLTAFIYTENRKKRTVFISFIA